MQETASSPDRDTPNQAAPPGEDDPIVLFDGVCHLCDRSVRFILEHDRDARFHFAPLQSALGKELLEKHGLPPESLETMVLIQRGTAHTKSSATLRVAGQLTFPWKTGILFLTVPKLLRDAVYGVVARNRYRWFGKRDACMIPDPRWKDRFHE